jgi:hypothetical protein
MQLRTALELNNEGRVFAYALDHPGCFIPAADESEALDFMVQAFIAYRYWVNLKAGQQSWLMDVIDIDIRLVETFTVYRINNLFEPDPDGDYDVNAWFQDDWLPLNAGEVERGLLLLQWSHKDLLDLIKSIPADKFSFRPDQESRTIQEILRHIAVAENWYLDRLNLGLSRDQFHPEKVVDSLIVVRQQLMRVLPTLTNKSLVIGADGEFWSPRKLLRRALYHEKDHIQHINQILNALH